MNFSVFGDSVSPGKMYEHAYHPKRPGEVVVSAMIMSSVHAVRKRPFLPFMPSGPWRRRKTEVANELAVACFQLGRAEEALKEIP